MEDVRATKKCVVVVDGDLPIGPMVNTAACLAVTLGSAVEGVVGEDATDGSGTVHAGLIPTGIAILRADAETVKRIRMKAEGAEGVFVADFTDAAQRTKDYPEYLANVPKVRPENSCTTASASTATRSPSTS
jgi:hypothetical protein